MWRTPWPVDHVLRIIIHNFFVARGNQGEVAKMDRERLKLALEDRPLRSELDTINEMYDGRLRTAEAELRRHAAEQSNRLQVRGNTVLGGPFYDSGRPGRAGGGGGVVVRREGGIRGGWLCGRTE